jgi:hypothetical protein
MFTAGPIVWVASNSVISVENQQRELIYVLENRFNIISTEFLCRYEVSDTGNSSLLRYNRVSVSSQKLPTLEKHCASIFKISAEKMDILYK